MHGLLIENVCRAPAHTNGPIRGFPEPSGA